MSRWLLLLGPLSVMASGAAMLLVGVKPGFGWAVVVFGAGLLASSADRAMHGRRTTDAPSSP